MKDSLHNYENLEKILKDIFDLTEQEIFIYYFDLDDEKIIVMNNAEIEIMFDNFSNEKFFSVFVEKRREVFAINDTRYYYILARMYMNDFVRTFEKIDLKNNHQFFILLKKLQTSLKLSKKKKRLLFELILNEYVNNYIKLLKNLKNKYMKTFLIEKNNFKFLRSNQIDLMTFSGNEFLMQKDSLNLTENSLKKFAHGISFTINKKTKKNNFHDYSQSQSNCIYCQKNELKNQFKVGFFCKECDFEIRREDFFLNELNK